MTDSLLVHYGEAVLLAGVFGLACLVVGHACLVRLLGLTLPFEEQLALALPLGVLAFFLMSNAFGYLGGYGLPFFVLGPACLLALGARSSVRTLRRLRAHLCARMLVPRLTPLRHALLAFGLLGLILVWLPILTPDNASFDSRWGHLPLAEDMVARGGIRATTEGWVHAAFPQLASLIYVWAFSRPGTLFDRIETAAHCELVVLLMTFVGIAAVVRRLLAKRSAFSWVALFLFPGIFCYDSGLVLGADHFAALWAAPIFLLALRFERTPDLRYGILLAAMTAGALNTKYTAAILLPLPVLTWLWVAFRFRRGSAPTPWLALAAAALTLLALTAPTWLKNAIFYGDPLFPVLRRWLPAHPWSAAANAPYDGWYALYRPALGASGVLDMLKVLATFAFVPHDFPQYHGTRAVFGFCFTLATPALFWLKPARPVWVLFASVYLGIVYWFWLHELDRYLQALVPWMAAGTAVVISLAWRAGSASRFGIVAALLAQLVHGAAVPFLPSHVAAGGSILRITIARLRGTGEFAGRDRLSAYPAWEAAGRMLPRGARVLVHELEQHIGLSASTLLDSPGDQGAFYWGEPGAASWPEVSALLRAHGVTHLFWSERVDHGTDTPAAALVFFDFALHNTRVLGNFSGLTLAELLPVPVREGPPREVAYFPCDPDPLYRPGLYPLGALTRAPGDTRPFEPPIARVSRSEALTRAGYLVYDARCNGPLPSAVRARFELLASRGNALLMARSAP